MTEREFLTLLDAYGADLSRWPAKCRDEALAFLATSPRVSRQARLAARMDRLLLECAPEVSPERIEIGVAAVLRRAEAQSRPPARRWDMSRLQRWIPASATYLGLFMLGGLFNLAIRLMAAKAPLDLLFSRNLLLPLGE